MLRPRHDKHPVTVAPLRDLTPSTGDALAAFRELRSAAEAWSPAASSTLREEAFARRFMQIRDQLAWRAGGGHALTVQERAVLHALDAVLDDLEPPREPLPPEVSEILKDYLGR